MITEEVRYLITYIHNKTGLAGVLAGQTKITQGNKTLATSFIGLARRAMLVIPVWMALRSAFMAFISSIRDGLVHIKELDKGLARAGAVMHGVANRGQAMKALGTTIRALGREMGVGAEEATEAFYRMGTAGLNVEESLAGMKIALKTSIAMMGDTTQTARGLADIYNLIGDRIEDAETAQEKMQKIGSTIAMLWKSNAFELNEYLSALKQFLPTAKLANLSMDEILGTIAVLHTLMRRSSTAGTEMSRTFIMLSNRLAQIETFLETTIDKDNINQFDLLIKILDKLNKKLKEGKNVAGDVASVFGIKAMKSVGALAGNLEKLTLQLKILSETDAIKRMEYLDDLFNLQMKTIDRQLKIFGELKKQSVEAFVMAAAGANDFATALEGINSYMINNVIPSMIYLGILANQIFSKISRFYGAIQKIFGYDEEPKKGGIGEYFRKTSFFPTTRDPQRRNEGLKELKGLAKEIGSPGEGMEWILDEIQRQMNVLLGQRDIDIEKQREKFATDYLAQLGDQGEKERKEASFKMQIGNLERLNALGYTSLEIEKAKLALMEASGRLSKDRAAQELQIAQTLNDEYNEFADTLKSAFSTNIDELLKGTKSFGELAEGISQAIKDAFTKEFSGLITRQLFKATGIGDIFSRQLMAIKHGFDYGAALTEKAIVGAFTTVGVAGIPLVKHPTAGSMIGLNGIPYYPGGYGPAGYGDLTSGTAGSSVLGARLQSRATGGLSGLPTAMSGGKARGRGILGGAGMIAMGGYTGYSMAQQSGSGGMGQAGGIMAGMGGAALMAGVGMGAVSGAMGGALITAGGITGGSAVVGGGIMAALGAIGPLGWIAIGALVAGTALSMFGGREPKTYSEEVREQTNQVSSRIDITNNQLEWVNRNLVAMRNELTFMMPNSYYFREREIADNFAFGTQRGNQ